MQNLKSVAANIIAMRKADLDLREKLIREGELSDNYHPEMRSLHNQNAEKLSKIIADVGYETITELGDELSEAAWLIIQHAIDKPEFMKSCLKLIEKAVANHKADPRSLAYLSDRIAVLQNEAQLYGTQFDWDENGELSPEPYDTLENVNNRRKSIGLNSLDEQIVIIRNRAKEENQSPPADAAKRKIELENWKKEVGWIK